MLCLSRRLGFRQSSLPGKGFCQNRAFWGIVLHHGRSKGFRRGLYCWCKSWCCCSGWLLSLNLGHNRPGTQYLRADLFGQRIKVYFFGLRRGRLGNLRLGLWLGNFSLRFRLRNLGLRLWLRNLGLRLRNFGLGYQGFLNPAHQGGPIGTDCRTALQHLSELGRFRTLNGPHVEPPKRHRGGVVCNQFLK